MCGVCGILFKDGKQTPDPGVLKRMTDAITHRGPDDDGHAVIGHVGLGMRRLSIIDLNTGTQPISNEDGKITLVFNGEIYNYQPLKAELEEAGHAFKTVSDTETIVHGYEEWGTAVCKHLNGMFGFALWDASRQRLMLARDRLGIKPMYFYQDSDKLVFGSEIKSILQAPAVNKTIDPDALNNFLTFEYIPSPRSIFKEIRKLEPGHVLIWENGSVTVEPYWTLKPEVRDWTEADARERLLELVNDSVRLRMIADVPLGAFLSGGLDSTTIVSQMAGLSDRPVKTFTIGFKESSYNEQKYAKAVADKYGTEHHEFTIEANALELTEKLVTQLDEPFGDFSIFPTFLVSRMARDFVTVTLSGDGGDELFAGYDTYRAHRFDRKYYHLLPKAVKKYLFGGLADALRPTEKKKGLVNSYKRFIEGTRLPKSICHARWMVFLQEAFRAQLFTPGYAETLGPDPYDFLKGWGQRAGDVDDITRTGFMDVKTYLTDNILVKVDRMSMLTSLEARVPLLDHRIVEFAFTLPPELKMKGLETKYLLKKTFWDFMPPEVQNRDKQGFSIPIKNWIRGELKPMMTDLLDESRLRNQGIFDAAFVSKLVDEHVKGIRNHSHLLWALMVFQQWHEIYV